MRARRLAWPAAVLAVASLHGLAAWTTPPRVPLDAVPDHLGERVRVAGRVRDVVPLESATIVEVTDGTLYLPALLRGELPRPVEPGDEVRLAGIVRLHEGAHELQGRADDLVVLETRGRPLDPATVAATPRRFADAPVRVRGLVEGEPGAWRVADEEASLALEPDPDEPPLRPGIVVVAEGPLTYDPTAARYRLEDATWRRP